MTTICPSDRHSVVVAAAREGNWREAIRIAAKFRYLGEHQVAITRAWAAIQNPQFYREIGIDPDDAIAAGVAALHERFLI